ncbi:MAG TPA: FAD-dependent oxidoreductase [Vicinamibacteria bacterium]|nr:FAD-dependent oxidoreductase [Vicinamibacteria bacterium]
MSDSRRSVLIVGASAAGLRCACRLARLRPGWQITVVEAGAVFSYAACGLPYVLSGDVEDLTALRQTTYGVVRDQRFFAEEKGVAVLTGWRATRAKLAQGLLKIEGPEGERQLSWDELVLATGARPRRLAKQPEHPRVRCFHGWQDLEPLKAGLAGGQIGRVVIVGAGPLGCELAEAFHSLWGAEVSMVEAGQAALPGVLDPELGGCVASHLEARGVRLLTGQPLGRLEADDQGVRVGAGGEELSADLVLVAIGVEPEVELARRLGVRLGPTGAIAVDERLATSVPHLWAAGDCVEVRDLSSGLPVYRPLGSLANRQGRVLANILAGQADSFPPVAGAMAVKVFDLNVAAVGATETALRARGVRVRSVWATLDDRSPFWPQNAELHLKLSYEPSSRRVLGVQAVGRGDAVKRVDVATQLIAQGATLAQFARLEHAYAPPYAPAVDPLAVLAFAAQNQEDGVEAVSPTGALEAALDVRLPGERQRRPAPAAEVQELALSVLRSGSPAAAGIHGPGIVICERGGRAAEAVRLLRESGRPARYLGGGLVWREAALDGGRRR